VLNRLRSCGSAATDSKKAIAGAPLMLHQGAHDIIFEGAHDIIFEGAHDIISEGTMAPHRTGAMSCADGMPFAMHTLARRAPIEPWRIGVCQASKCGYSEYSHRPTSVRQP
jgi:hypothetical protein